MLPERSRFKFFPLPPNGKNTRQVLLVDPNKGLYTQTAYPDGRETLSGPVPLVGMVSVQDSPNNLDVRA